MFRKTLRFLAILLLLMVAAVAGYWYLMPTGASQDAYAFIPGDFVYLIESDEPIQDWQGTSSSPVWQYLKGSNYFGEITESADYLDSLLNANTTLVKMAKLGSMVISAHMVSSQAYEFLIVVDLKGEQGPKLQPVMGTLFKSFGYQVKEEDYFNYRIYNLYDPVSRETLSLCLVNNVLLASYNLPLLKKGIAQSEQPSILEIESLKKVRTASSHGKLYTFYLSYAHFEKLLKAYTTTVPDLLTGLDEALTFSGLDLAMDDYVELDGYSLQIDSAATFLNVFKETGRGKITMESVLPNTTALYVSVGFNDCADLFRRYNDYLSKTAPDDLADLEKNQKRIEKLLKIEFERDFFYWMTEEVGTALVPYEPGSEQYDYYALFHFDDYDQAQERLDYVIKRIGKTPLKFESMDYRGYNIRYLELKGLFSIFFKKLFSKMEKPHFAVVDKYVVFSNDTSSLIRFIDHYLADEVLARDEAHMDFRQKFDGSSNIFACMRQEYLLGYILSQLDPQARRDLLRNRDYLLSFPEVGFQMYPASGMFRTYMYAPFKPPMRPAI